MNYNTKQNSNLFLIRFYIVLLIILVIDFLLLERSFSIFNVYYLLSFFIVILFSFFFRTEKFILLAKQKFKISYLFLFSFIVVHFQYYFDLALDETLLPIFTRKISDPDTLIKSGIISLIGLVSFLLGYLIKRDSVKLKLRNKKYRHTYMLKALCFFSFIYFIVSLDLVKFFLGDGSETDSLSYYAMMLLEVSIISVLLSHSHNLSHQNRSISLLKFITSLGFVVNFILVIYLALVALSGDRGPIISFALVYTFSYIKASNKIFDKKLIFISISIGLLFIIQLGVVRSLNKNLSYLDRISSSFNQDSRFSYKSIIPFTQELSKSSRCLNIAVGSVPEINSFFYGRFQLQQIISAIPFTSFLNTMIFDNIPEYKGSTYYITWRYQGQLDGFNGIGSTCIADLYLDFGVFGVAFGMLLFGYLLRQIELYSIINHSNVFISCLTFSFMFFAIGIARQSILMPLKYLALLYIVLKLSLIITSRNTKLN